MATRRLSARPTDGPTGSEPSVAEQLKARFDAIAKDTSSPLFKDWATYAVSLPVREHSDRYRAVEILKLHELSYFAADDEVEHLRMGLEEAPYGRGDVKYVCAPANSGKTFIRASSLRS